MEEAQQLNIVVANAPSSLARVTDKLRSAEVNISAITCTEGREKTTIHLIVDDIDTAKIALRDIGTVSTTDVLGFRMKNTPGAIATISRALAAAGVNIHNIYATTCGKEAMVYVSLDHMTTAIAQLQSWKDLKEKNS